ncbi:hypothetical protein COLAER_00818 [Collinsella aerofaciens ATCC 25986]|uniref:Uncharacterized protein n=1 Tax=Collinsella aerofaciens (strain ATCC 25986 / DSM 3979 / JCM 10188 / KCTC 3647 / NCTC 11838 / VPI 1003) TaxID=411903 RepID=A4E8S7_COLAA|nr:hypothetical protein COLAER_00818 [Collinsella aerofaciens ATCC 25986]
MQQRIIDTVQIARDKRLAHTRVECGQVQRHVAATRKTKATQVIHGNVAARLQVIDQAHVVPNVEARNRKTQRLGHTCLIQTRTAQVAVLVIALALPVTTVSPTARIRTDGYVTHACQTQTVVVIELTHGIIDSRHARNTGYACCTRSLMAMRADITAFESPLIKLRMRRFQQVERHPNIALDLQHRMSAHDAAGNPHAAELTNLNRGRGP